MYLNFTKLCWILWPVITFTGGLAFSPLISVLGLLSLGSIIRYKNWSTLPLYFILWMVFIIWMTLSTFWSGQIRGFIFWQPDEMQIALTHTPTRIGLIFISIGLAIYGTLQFNSQQAKQLIPYIMGAFIVQTITLTGLALYYDKTLEVILPLTQLYNEGVQNIGRNANLLAVAIPILFAWLMKYLNHKLPEQYKKPSIIGLFSALTCLSIFIFITLSAYAAILAFIIAIPVFMLIYLLPRSGFHRLSDLIAGYLLLAPAFMNIIVTILFRFKDTIPLSAYWRAETWHYVIDRIGKRPFWGWGVDDTKSWHDRLGDHAGILTGQQVIPGHPHNMALHIWAETGFIGILLIVSCIWCLRRILPCPHHFNVIMYIAIAGMLGGSLALFSVSYSVWNDAFWAAIGFLIIALIILKKSQDI